MDPCSSRPAPPGPGQANQGLSLRFRISTQQSIENPVSETRHNFPRGQTWATIPSDLTFVDETNNLVTAYDNDGAPGGNLTRAAANQPFTTFASTNRPPAPVLAPAPLPPPPAHDVAFFPAVANSQGLDPSLAVPFNFNILAGSAPEPDLSLIAGDLNLFRVPDVAHYLTRVDQPQWDGADMLEKRLYQIFINSIAPIFDLCDHEGHFFRVVPQRAINCLALRYTMLATAAKYFAKYGGGDDSAFHLYSDKCYNTLIPSLSSPDAVMNEDLWASVVMLRFMEEVDLPFSRNGTHSHMIGTRLFFVNQSKVDEFEGLRLATFWCAFRQEIFSAVLHGRQIELSELTTRIEPFSAPFKHNCDCDCSYANWAVVHCAAAVQTCHATPPNPEEWNDVRGRLDDWWENRPWKFDVLSFVPEASRTQYFPQRIGFGDAPVIALQHYYLARLVMVLRDPTVPAESPAREARLAANEKQIKEFVGELCGIAQSNPKTSPAFALASLAVKVAANYYQSKGDQAALCDFLQRADVQSPWQTQDLQEELKKVWGWIDPQPVPAY